MATNFPKSASPSEPRCATCGRTAEWKYHNVLNHGEDSHKFVPLPKPESNREHIIWNQGRLKGLAEGIRTERRKWTAEPRRDEREALEQACKLITEFDVSEGNQHRRNLAIDALYRWRNVTEEYLASRASAAPLKQTANESLQNALRELLDAANLVSYDEDPPDEDGERYEAARLNAAKTLASLPQPSPLECPKCGWTVDDENFTPIKVAPSAGQTEGK